MAGKRVVLDERDIEDLVTLATLKGITCHECACTASKSAQEHIARRIAAYLESRTEVIEDGT